MRHSFVRLLHYGPRPNPISFGQHTDLGLATMFAGETTPALELRDRPGDWVQLRSGWVMATGDMFTAMSGGTARAALHRVRSTSRERWAAVVFAHPDPGYRLRVDEYGRPLTANAFFLRARAAAQGGAGRPGDGHR